MQCSNRWIKLRNNLTVAGLLLVATACVSGPPENLEPVGPERIGVYPLAGINKIVLDLPVGAAQIIRGSPEQLSVEIRIACDIDSKSCLKLAETVALTNHRSGDKLIVGPGTRSRYAYRNSQTDYLIKVPDDMPLTVIFGYGEITIDNVASDLRIEMSAGEVNVNIPESAVRHVWLDANVGDASLIGTPTHQEDQRRLLVGAEVDWKEGTGKYDISIDIGAGDITVRLTE